MSNDHSVATGVIWGYPSWRDECHLRDLIRTGKFAWQRALGEVDNLTAAAHHVALACAHFAAVDGTRMFAGEKRIATMCRRSVRHVRTQLRRLVAAGYLKRLTHGGGRPRRGQQRRYGARYELTLPAHLARDESRAQQPRTSRRGEDVSPDPAPAVGDVNDPAAVAAGLIDKLRDTLQRPGLTVDEGTEIAKSILDAAAARVKRPSAYVLTSVQRDPQRWRPTPTPGDPCGIHPLQQAARCPDCRAAPPASPETISRARAAARNPDAT
ncbi:hypothetical protein CLV30_101150 [Haloactinopolyspora alba]|uniref:Helix-turn-helix protein n=1 Tax=Haloactinopolyspora alba TaxID=648780 RepID=A0A2P8EFF1_9ACTN|nr:hypothetical protein [Haloactinopolyspora alba]PSL08183.1 hypothetical protein CLV30_101150 [Haloactinopolyspora alba]